MASSDIAKYDPVTHQFLCEGEWTLANITRYKKKLAQVTLPRATETIINGSEITKMDSSGAWLLNDWITKLKQKGFTIHLQHFSERQQKLLTMIEKDTSEEGELPKVKVPYWLTSLGKKTLQQFDEFCDFLAFIGYLTIEALRILKQPGHIRINALTNTVDQTGFKALPIIGLLSFMIGVVLAYQMGTQLRNYGANVFVVDLLGLSILREFGPLLTAIMVAGRTGSAFTAQLGTMRVNQEIDAIDVMGVTSAELLLLPRLFGLLIALPLLTVWADAFGIFGGMFMANNMLDIGFSDFLMRFQHQVPLKSLIIGLGKAPVFALIIASIGCFQGMRVKGSADSVGTQTTRSVVLAIFFIIVADAIFSVLFSKFKL